MAASDLDMSPDISVRHRHLKEFLFEKVYWNPSVEGTELKKAQRSSTTSSGCTWIARLMQGRTELRDARSSYTRPRKLPCVPARHRDAVGRFMKHFLPSQPPPLYME